MTGLDGPFAVIKSRPNDRFIGSSDVPRYYLWREVGVYEERIFMRVAHVIRREAGGEWDCYGAGG